MKTILIALMLLAMPTLAAETSPGLGGSGMTGGRGGYLGPQGAAPISQQNEGRAHIIYQNDSMFIMTCDSADDAVAEVDGQLKCKPSNGNAYQPVFQSVGGYCNPSDKSGYYACTKPEKHTEAHRYHADVISLPANFWQRCFGGTKRKRVCHHPMKGNLL
jgi:hypothetical protein